ncbi:MAG: hypothetical protein ACXWOL_00570 [Ktedonobacteraceae bacterium]
MSETWLHDYILLAFRIHRLVQIAYDCPFVEEYYGPPELRTQAESEQEPKAADLVRQTMMLGDALPAQGFASNRIVYLGKHVKAMEMLCRKLCGEHFSLKEEAEFCLDIHPEWTPEEEFEKAHALYEKVLPGKGSLAESLRTYRAELAYPEEHMNDLSQSIDMAFAEARRRTSSFIELPDGEAIEIQYLAEWEYDAAAYYKGNFRTQIVMNVASTATYISRLFDHKVCHEGYPGHHTEYGLKEQYLYLDGGYIEQSICLTLCPQCVIQEGIAMLAHEMIFADGEAEQWIEENIYRPLHKDIDAIVLLRLRQASQLLGSVWDNAALLLDDGRSEQEVAHYFTKYMLLAEDRAAQMVAHLKHPIWGRYELMYANGQKLMRPWLQGTDRHAVFRRFLTEQFTPSQLEGNTLPVQV